MRSTEFHVEENPFVSEDSTHHWLIETALNAVVCAHRTRSEADACCECFRQWQHKTHN